MLWFDQVDAAALVDADTKNDGGGRARVLSVARKGTKRKGENGKDPRPYL